ncbi:hypothetical protein [Croceicoccus sp. BE223]|uniref:hypothetical protein n=1 Tax=Croceicoccus sp. BE223 TaxID=2817716 RepID=UPI0028649427|nr:hypothetical protein [Croceicoccus sp. BE223]MDR7102967.1 hypothetical protein [Croceicoccus sp. BE223]
MTKRRHLDPRLRWNPTIRPAGLVCEEIREFRERRGSGGCASGLEPIEVVRSASNTLAKPAQRGWRPVRIAPSASS